MSGMVLTRVKMNTTHDSLSKLNQYINIKCADLLRMLHMLTRYLTNP